MCCDSGSNSNMIDMEATGENVKVVRMILEILIEKPELVERRNFLKGMTLLSQTLTQLKSTELSDETNAMVDHMSVLIVAKRDYNGAVRVLMEYMDRVHVEIIEQLAAKMAEMRAKTRPTRVPVDDLFDDGESVVSGLSFDPEQPECLDSPRSDKSFDPEQRLDTPRSDKSFDPDTYVETPRSCSSEGSCDPDRLFGSRRSCGSGRLFDPNMYMDSPRSCGSRRSIDVEGRCMVGSPRTHFDFDPENDLSEFY